MENKQQENTPAFEVNVDPVHTQILYTDNISIVTSPDGLVMDVVQRLGGSNKFQVVARIGMSREHAKRFAGKLAELLIKSEGQVETGNKPTTIN